jgi:hypothetical protein
VFFDHLAAEKNRGKLGVVITAGEPLYGGDR